MSPALIRYCTGGFEDGILVTYVLDYASTSRLFFSPDNVVTRLHSNSETFSRLGLMKLQLLDVFELC